MIMVRRSQSPGKLDFICKLSNNYALGQRPLFGKNSMLGRVVAGEL